MRILLTITFGLWALLTFGNNLDSHSNNSQKWDYWELYLTDNDTVSAHFLDENTRNLIHFVANINDERNYSDIDSNYEVSSQLVSFENEHFLVYSNKVKDVINKYTLDNSIFISLSTSPFSYGLRNMVSFKSKDYVFIYNFILKDKIRYVFPRETNRNTRVIASKGILYTGRYLVVLNGQKRDDIVYTAVGGYKGPFIIYDLTKAVSKKVYKKRRRKEKKRRRKEKRF
jgi:hypothetical protein